jgi:hypothetical protein
MSDSWKTVKANEVRTGDTIRTKAGEVVIVSRIQPQFLNRPEMLAFIEDTEERWYKRPVAADAEVEVRTDS